MPAIDYNTETEIAEALAGQLADILEMVDPQQYWQLIGSDLDDAITQEYIDSSALNNGENTFDEDIDEQRNNQNSRNYPSDANSLDGIYNVLPSININADFIEQISDWFLKDDQAFEQLRVYFGGYSEPFEVEPEFQEVEDEIFSFMDNFDDFLNKRLEHVVAKYRCNYMDNPSEIENIATKFENGQYYNHYMFDDEHNKGAHRTGPFRTEAEAQADIRKNRPKAWSVSNILTFTMPVEPAVSFIVKGNYLSHGRTYKQVVRCSTIDEAVRTFHDLSKDKSTYYVKSVSMSLIDKDNEGIVGVPVVENMKLVDEHLRANESYYSNPTVIKAFNELNKAISPILKEESRLYSATRHVKNQRLNDAVYKRLNNIRIDQVAYTLNPDMMPDVRIGKETVAEGTRQQNQTRKSVEKSLDKMYYPNGFLLQVVVRDTNLAHNKSKTLSKAYVVESDSLKGVLDFAREQVNRETVYTGQNDLAISGDSIKDDSHIRITVRAFNKKVSQKDKDSIPIIVAHGRRCYKFIERVTVSVADDVRKALHIPTLEAEHSALSDLNSKKKEVKPANKDDKGKSNDEHNGR